MTAPPRSGTPWGRARGQRTGALTAATGLTNSKTPSPSPRLRSPPKRRLAHGPLTAHAAASPPPHSRRTSFDSATMEWHTLGPGAGSADTGSSRCHRPERVSRHQTSSKTRRLQGRVWATGVGECGGQREGREGVRGAGAGLTECPSTKRHRICGGCRGRGRGKCRFVCGYGRVCVVGWLGGHGRERGGVGCGRPVE